MFLRIHSFIFTVCYSILTLYFHLFPFGVVETTSASVDQLRHSLIQLKHKSKNELKASIPY